MVKYKNGHHFVNMHHTEKFQITTHPPPKKKFGSMVFWVQMEMEYRHWPLWKNGKWLLTPPPPAQPPPKVWIWVSMEMEYGKSKNGHHFVNICIIQKNFKLLTPPPHQKFGSLVYTTNHFLTCSLRYKSFTCGWHLSNAGYEHYGHKPHHFSGRACAWQGLWRSPHYLPYLNGTHYD